MQQQNTGYNVTYM